MVKEYVHEVQPIRETVAAFTKFRLSYFSSNLHKLIALLLTTLHMQIFPQSTCSTFLWRIQAFLTPFLH